MLCDRMGEASIALSLDQTRRASAWYQRYCLGFHDGLVQGEQDIRRRIWAVCAGAAILAVVRPHPPGRYLRPSEASVVVGRADCLAGGGHSQTAAREARFSS